MPRDRTAPSTDSASCCSLPAIGSRTEDARSALPINVLRERKSKIPLSNQATKQPTTWRIPKWIARIIQFTPGAAGIVWRCASWFGTVSPAHHSRVSGTLGRSVVDPFINLSTHTGIPWALRCRFSSPCHPLSFPLVLGLICPVEGIYSQTNAFTRRTSWNGCTQATNQSDDRLTTLDRHVLDKIDHE